MANHLSPELDRYLVAHHASRSPILREMEQWAKENDFPIFGPECGRTVATLSVAIEARRVFEMGSGVGYSTVWFAAAVGPTGEVVHTDGDAANTEAARGYLDRAGFLDRCRFLNGDALELLAQEQEPFDCILIDVNKTQYPLALRIATEKLRYGGLIFTHNAIWSGRVADTSDMEPSTVAIRQYNRDAVDHPELMTFLDPIHDGLAISLKVGEAHAAVKQL